jgi:hypothetical protein
MKRVLLGAAITASFLVSNAQTNLHVERANELNRKHITIQNIGKSKEKAALPEPKKTRGAEWFSYFDAAQDTNSTGTFYAPLWPDSLAKWQYSNGLFAADMTTYSSILDATSTVFQADNVNSGYAQRSFQVTPTTPFTVDSIRTFGLYKRLLNKPNVVDTLRFVYTASNVVFSGTASLPTCNIYIDDNYYAGLQGDYPGYDTVSSYMTNLDPVKTRMEGTGTFVKDLYLTSSAYPDTSNFGYFSIPSNMNVAANGLVISSVSFISGETYPLNSSITNYNHFRPLTYSYYKDIGTPTEDETFPPYKAGDINECADADYRAITYPANSIGFNFYIGTIFNNGRDANGVALNSRNQFSDIEYYINCATCTDVVPVKVNDVKLEGVSVSPNPASNYLDIKIQNNTAGKVSVTMTNLVGQQVITKTFNKSNAMSNLSLNMESLPKGVYTLTVDVNGIANTQKVVKN